MQLSSLFDIIVKAAKEHVRKTSERTPTLAAYIPGIYHEEAEQKFSPLKALLLLIEDNFIKITKILDEIDRYFDTRRAPAGEGPGQKDFISWLYQWVGMVPGQNWSVQKKRYVLGIAADLHQYRGTAAGLRCMLALFFEIDVEIKEWDWPQGMQIGVHNTIEMDTRIDDQFNINQCFTVTWKPRPEELETDLKYKIARIRYLIDREKPAHTFCYFNVVGFEEEGLKDE
jgi:phage tail-like protein